MDAVAGQQFHVRVVDETDAVQVDYAKVRSVRLDLADIDHFINLFRLLVSQLKRSYTSRHRLFHSQTFPPAKFNVLCRDYNCDSTTIWLRSDYDVSRAPASIRREQKMNMSIYRRGRIVVES